MELYVGALLLDIDGTLVDSTPAVERTWRAWAENYGFDAARIIAESHGRRTEDMISTLLPEEQVAAACSVLDKMELEDLEGVVALPGVLSMLRELGMSGWGVVTSGGARLMRARLAAAGLPSPEVFISAEDVSQGKPDPQGYLLAARKLGVSPSRSLVIEDAPAGIRAGKAAGATVLAVATSHKAEELSDADYVVNSLENVLVQRQDAQFVVRSNSMNLKG
ncbi:HAD family hydrolase [Glutamicibacter sp. AGC13]